MSDDSTTCCDFDLAGGSTIGRDHRVVPKNNQDAYRILIEHPRVAVVADGCGSGQHSEVGAQIGARLLCDAIAREYLAQPYSQMRWAKVENDVISQLHQIALSMGGNFREVVEEHFLFTLVGVVIGASYATFFALGDGVVVINNLAPIFLEPDEGNKPLYLGYRMLDGWGIDVETSELHIQELARMPLKYLSSFLIGCDGVRDLVSLTEAQLPGVKLPVGPLSQFWEQDANFTNPIAISRKLKLIGRDWHGDAGLLPDDTTLVVGRQCPE